MNSDLSSSGIPQNYLLVEGKDDEHVFYSLLTHYYNIPERFKIKNKEGIDKLLATLDVELARTGLNRLGIVVDADLDLAARWQSLRNILSDAGYGSVPLEPEASGTIIQQSRQPTVGIWLMPDNKLPGMLEDFVSFLIPDSSSLLWAMAEQIIQEVSQQERRFPPSHTIKVHLHTWLAWQEEPGSPMGLAITRRYFDAEAPCARQLMDWLCRLFDLT